MTGSQAAQDALFPSAAQQVLAEARARADRREAARARRGPVDYPAINAEFRRQKTALTRAINSGDPEKIVLVCRAAVRAWNQPRWAGWPDDWPRWQAALDDALGWRDSIDLRDLA